MAGHERPHFESRRQPPAEVSDPPAQRVEERPVECHTRIPRSRRPVAVGDGQAGDESSYSVSPGHPGGIALSDSEKVEALADILETQPSTFRLPWQVLRDFPVVMQMSGYTMLSRGTARTPLLRRGGFT